MHRKSKWKNFQIGIFLLALLIGNVSIAEITHRNMLEDFEGEHVYLDDRGSPNGWYFQSNTNGGRYTWQVDPTQGADGTQRSLKMTVTDGVPMFFYLNQDKNAYINEGSEVPTNRMRFYMKLPEGWRRTDPLPYNYNFHIGTYHRNPEILGNQETNNWHFYYHLVFDAYDEEWIRVDLGMWTQHQRGYKLNPGVNATKPIAHFNQHFSRVYFTGVPHNEQPQVALPYNIWFDEWEFYYQNEYVATQPEYYENEVLPGGTRYYPVTVTNTHPTEYRRFGLVLSTQLFNSGNGWTHDITLLRDDNQDGEYQFGEDFQADETPLLAPNEKYALLVRVVAPASGAGANPGAYWQTSLTAWQKEPVWRDDPHLVASANNLDIPLGTPATSTQIKTHVVSRLAPADTVPPAVIRDLAVEGADEHYVKLSWTATGDDGDTGGAYAYDVRYSTSPITLGNFDEATPFSDELAPAASGSEESHVLPPVLQAEQLYYFALKAYDETYRSVGISNVVSAWTNAPTRQPNQVTAKPVRNQPPVAVAEATPLQGAAPLSVSFSSANSSDPDGTIDLYHWDLGNGVSSNEPNPVHIYEALGTHQVMLTVTDNLGSTSSNHLTVEVYPDTAGVIQCQEGAAGYSGTSVNRILDGRNADNVYLNVSWATRTGSHGGASRLIVRFENLLQLIPKGSQLLSAKLKLFHLDSKKAEGHVVEAYPVLRAFDKQTVTWMAPWSEPGASGVTDIGGAVDAVTLDDSVSVWRVWDVTSIVSRWHSDELVNNGILLRSQKETSGYALYAYPGHEVVAERPVLEIAYVMDGQSDEPEEPTQPGKPTHIAGK